MKLAPLIYAVILFLMIRLTNDLPTGSNYLAHSWRFIVIELTGVLAASYLCFYLANKWIRFSMAKRVHPISEYGLAVLVPSLFSLLVMAASHDTSLWKEIPNLIIPVVIVMLMSLGLYISQKSSLLDKMYNETIIREQEIINAKTETDLKMLRAQFHPHFLFNMLNTLYFTIDESNTKARETVEHMASLLRYQLYDNQGMVPIEREIQAMESYIALYRTRFEDTAVIDCSIDHRFSSDLIYPHLLLPLVENAIKHSGGEKKTISVVLTRNFNIVEFSVVNSIPDATDSGKHESGIGLKNIRRTLDLMYKGRYEFSTRMDSDKYHTYLKIAL